MNARVSLVLALGARGNLTPRIQLTYLVSARVSLVLALGARGNLTPWIQLTWCNCDTPWTVQLARHHPCVVRGECCTYLFLQLL
ncbi:hypothetical protein BGW80DRAFT_1291727 [Lactifluus volemus]|nr:hypothetical protein BGW80DRAFT_1291727 [Lactifluus volemus]